MSVDCGPWRWLFWGMGFPLVVLLVLVPSGFLWDLVRPVLHKDVINRYAAVYKFDPLFVMALVKEESHFQNQVTSHRGAVGLMQLMPETARDMARGLGLNEEDTLRNLEDPNINVRLGYAYLSILRDEFKADVVAILAAYNAGPADVRAWRKNGLLTIDQIPYLETQRFVMRIERTHRWLKRLQKAKNVAGF